jgi:hypothetical protein
MYIFKKIRNILIGTLALMYIFFGHILWNKVAKPVYKRINVNEYYVVCLDYIEFKMNRYFILASFTLIYSLSKLIEIYSLAFFAKGYVIAGIIMYGVAMIPVIIAFAVLERGKEKLFTLNWFKYGYDKIVIFITFIKKSYSYKYIIHVYRKCTTASKQGLISKLFNTSVNKIEKRNDNGTKESVNNI